MTAFEFILHLGVIPMSIEKPCTKPTNSEIKRWLNQSAVIINNQAAKPNDEIQFPVTHLVFFPKSANRKTTVI